FIDALPSHTITLSLHDALPISSAIIGPNDQVVIPKNSTKTDWEVELGVVIGKKAAYVSEAEAMDYVAGYCLHNDYSARAFQLERDRKSTRLNSSHDSISYAVFC